MRSLEWTIRENLRQIDVVGGQIDIFRPGPDVVLVRLIAETFKGQSYFDREDHIRPALLEALADHGLSQAELVIEAHTPEEEAPSNDTVFVSFSKGDISGQSLQVWSDYIAERFVWSLIYDPEDGVVVPDNHAFQWFRDNWTPNEPLVVGSSAMIDYGRYCLQGQAPEGTALGVLCNVKSKKDTPAQVTLWPFQVTPFQGKLVTRPQDTITALFLHEKIQRSFCRWAS